MKLVCAALACLSFTVASLGQSPSPEARTRSFGSSLDKGKKSKEREEVKKPAPLDQDEILVDTDLVINDVLVTNGKGDVIGGLKKGDFLVSEDGTEQSIEIFSSRGAESVARSIVLIIDSGVPQASFLKSSIEAAKGLVDRLGAEDEMAIVTVDLRLRLDFTKDRSLLKANLNELLSENLSNFNKDFEALMAVLNEMFDRSGRQGIVVFQGDGGHMIWLKPDSELPYPVSHSTRMNSGMKYGRESKSMSKFSFSDVRSSIERSRVTIYSVATGLRFFGLPEKERVSRARISWDNWEKSLGLKSDYPPNQRRMFVDREEKVRTAGQAAMYRVAELSGGNTAIMEKPEDAEKIYSTLFDVIKSRYVLGYYPTNQEKGPKRRTVKIEVRGHPEYTVTTRNTYILQ